MRIKAIFPVGALFLSCGLVPAHAVVLEQKWVAGEKVAYDFSLSGVINLQAPADAPVLWAGVPLEVDLQGKGKSTLHTLGVDPSGTASVVFTVPSLKVVGESLGQKGELKVEEGVGGFFLNGKPINMGGTAQAGTAATRMLVEPPVALRLTRTGKLAGFEDLKKDTAAKTAAPAAKPTPGTGTTLEGALDRTALAQAMILRSLPALWPTRDVSEGETWQAVVGWPNPAPNVPGTPLGQFDLTLKGQETLDGVSLWRVAVQGGLELDAAKLAQVNAPGAGNKAAGSLSSARQKVSGDLWFDAERGQIARANLKLNSEMAGRGPAVEGKAAAESFTDFIGSFNLVRAKPTVQ